LTSYPFFLVPLTFLDRLKASKNSRSLPSNFFSWCSPVLPTSSCAATMPGKKRTTNQKTSAVSKRHKPSTSTSKKPKGAYTSAKPETLNDDAAPKHTGSFPADKPSRESAKKDRKGKGPAFIETVQGHDLSDESSGGEEGGMEVDEDLDDNDQAQFLMKLDMKGMAA
jgi:nucleolar complex protein 3